MKAKPKGAKYRNLVARGGAIYYRRKVGERVVRFTCETDDGEAAAGVRDLYEARKGIGRLPGLILEEEPQPTVPLFSEMAERYLRRATAHLAATTRKDHERLLGAKGPVTAYFGALRLDEITRGRLVEWWEKQVEGAGRSPKKPEGTTSMPWPRLSAMPWIPTRWRCPMATR